MPKRKSAVANVSAGQNSHWSILHVSARLAILLLVFSIVSSCTATRFIPKDKGLLHKNLVEVEGKPVNFSKSDLEYLIAQKPNRKFLGNRFGLWFHYYSGRRLDKKFWAWVHKNAGQQPVYVDEGQSDNTAHQLHRFSYNKGYFNNEVSYRVDLHKNRLATVVYKVKLNKPYVIDSISQQISDSNIVHFVDSISGSTLLRSKRVYDAYQIDSERDRITNFLKNNGYFNFTKDDIFFEVDSSLRKHALHLRMVILNPKKRNGETAPFHKRYFIRDVFVFPRHDPFALNQPDTDTLWYKRRSGKGNEFTDLAFVFHEDMKIKPQIFNNIIQIGRGEPFSINKLRQTYKGLTNLKIYRASNIAYDTVAMRQAVESADSNFLNCNIYLQRNKANAYSVELEGTNSGGDLGIRGSLVFTNKNLFRGSEVLRLRLNGGIEAQRINTSGVEGLEDASIFNTTEVGIDANIHFPRFLSPFSLRKFAKEYLPKTNINLGYSNQSRHYYNRTILKATFGYDWMTTPTRQHQLIPINLSSVKVNPSPAFQEFLDEQTNQRFKDQYSDHLILGSAYSYIYNNQNVNKLKDFFYYRLNVESAGSLVSMFNNSPLTERLEGYHTLLGIRYAQYLRIDHDFRYYRVLSKEHRLVWRIMMGIGYSFGNSEEMPFEKSYFAGGSNGMRGWQLRHLGPGAYSENVDIERTGDIQLETNLEYRFPVVSFFKAALFVDAGNIWTLRNQSYFTGGQFEWNDFYRELALDAGVGFRFDFSFFIFRLDAAVPIRDPAMPESDRWRLSKLRLNQLVWNFGIGYPF